MSFLNLFPLLIILVVVIWLGLVPLKSIKLWQWLLIVIAVCFIIYWGLYAHYMWREDVLLHDGRVITVYRTAKAKGCCGENFSSGEVVSQKIIFHDEHGWMIWDDDITPIIFDMVGSTYYVVASPGTGRDCRRHGNPNPPYIFYKYESGKWIQIDHANCPDDLQINLLTNWDPNTGNYQFVVKGGKVTVDEKQWLDGKMESGQMLLPKFNKDLNRACNLM